ncbi:putative gustatory receptor 28b [Neodiprion pinetum]|uniref:putative gustatory receptor 28b n=1 Tax=Neodiprion pinetum TaxID=441929 RepID=UPI00371D33FA
MKWKTGYPISLMLIYYLAKFAGLASFTLKKNIIYPSTLPGRLYPFVFATCNLLVSFITTYRIMKSVEGDSTTIDRNVQLVYYFGKRLCTFCALITFLSMHKDTIELMNKLCIVSNKLKILGIQEDHSRFFNNLFVMITTVNIANCAITQIITLLSMEQSIVVTVQNHISRFTDLNVILSFCCILLCIKHRFSLMNEKLYVLFQALHPYGFSSSFYRTSVINSRQISRDVNRSSSTAVVSAGVQNIRIAATLHLELCDLLERTTRIFAGPILVFIVKSFFTIVLGSYWMYKTCMSLNQTMLEKFSVFSVRAFILVPALRMLVIITELFVIAHAGATTSEQGEATKALLSKVWMDFQPLELAEKFLMFSTQLLHKSPAIFICGLTPVDYSYLFKV